jgi:hypothetical protein
MRSESIAYRILTFSIGWRWLAVLTPFPLIPRAKRPRCQLAWKLDALKSRTRGSDDELNLWPGRKSNSVANHYTHWTIDPPIRSVGKKVFVKVGNNRIIWFKTQSPNQRLKTMEIKHSRCLCGCSSFLYLINFNRRGSSLPYLGMIICHEVTLYKFINHMHNGYHNFNHAWVFS